MLDQNTGPEQTLAARALAICDRLRDLYPDAICTLTFSSPLQLLVATILSAQCTDERVNMVTPALFATYPTAQSFADAPLEDLEEAIRTTGFFRNKARHIQAASRLIVEQFGGDVPSTMESLLTLPGVARKTANVVLGNAFDQVVGFTVDTHVGRLSRRLGLTVATDPVHVEDDLMAVVPPSEWLHLSHRFIAHGRAICDARRPKCGECALAPLCPSAGNV